MTAAAAVVGVLVVTAALIWFLRPHHSSPSSNTPVSVPQATLPTESTAPPTPASQP
jgi:hypothetical protein